jgi:GH15 family glucan-1,4-alpha-glucosidase
MDRYPSISEHGLIGDLQTAALVSTDGTIDWFCSPRFDSPSIFASLLDHDRGGYFHIGLDRDDYVSRQLYLPDTAILITRFLTSDGVGEVLDFMPVAMARYLHLPSPHLFGPPAESTCVRPVCPQQLQPR